MSAEMDEHPERVTACPFLTQYSCQAHPATWAEVLDHCRKMHPPKLPYYDPSMPRGEEEEETLEEFTVKLDNAIADETLWRSVLEHQSW